MRYSLDPRWLTARFDSKCAKCARVIRRGERIFYYPNGRKAYCDGPECGSQYSAEFAAAVHDEAFMNGSAY